MKTNDAEVRQLEPNDVEAFQTLRREGLMSHPLSFGASVEDEANLAHGSIVASFDSPKRSAVFGGFLDRSLVGVVGVQRHGARKASHRAYVWGMYVTPAARGRGLGRSLLAAAVAHARSWPGLLQLQVTVTDVSPEARHLYESFGFRTWGREPRTLCWGDTFADEYHLVLMLDEVAG